MLVESTEPSTYEQRPVSVQAERPVVFDPACFTHDLAQLLTAILCNVSMAKGTLDSGEPAFRQLTDAEIAALRAKDLIQQFATFGRAGDSGKTPCNSVSFSLSRLCLPFPLLKKVHRR